MEIRRIGKTVEVKFPTEVQASDFEKRLRRVWNEKLRDMKKHEKEIRESRRQFEKNLWPSFRKGS